VFLAVWKPNYEQRVAEQLASAREKLGEGDVDSLLRQGDTWTVRG